MTDRHDQQSVSEAGASDNRFAEWALFICGEVDAEVEDDWNQWYDDVHLPQIMACPGFVRAVRYIKDKNDEARTFVTMYELEGPAAATTPELQNARGLGPFVGKVRTSMSGLYHKHKVCEANEMAAVKTHG